MANNKLGLIVLFVSLIFILSGCGAELLDEEEAAVLNVSDGTAVVFDYSGAKPVSSTVCFVCHSDAAQPAGRSPVFGDSSADGWLDGPHGNNESIDASHQHVDLSPDNVGFPDYDYFSDETCKTCHDKRDDGKTILAFYAETGIDALGRVDRPIIGCEGCHGSAEDHADVGAALVQHAAPGAGDCQPCHNDTFPDGHLTYHPEGDRIYENYIASPHAGSISRAHYVSGSTTDVKAKCSKCHTDEGAKLYKDVTGDRDALGVLDSNPAVSDASVVQCRTCHDAHNPDTLLKAATASNSAEYETCTNCHQTSDGYHGEDNGHSWGPEEINPDSEVGVGNFDSIEIIYDTHFDNPNTPQRNASLAAIVNTGGIEGYVLDTSNPRVCRDCHNVHSSDITINEQWAKSAHAGHILEVKETAFENTSSAPDPYAEALAILNGSAWWYGAVTEETGPAWVHYEWKAASRQSCQQCHTATGYKNFMTNPMTYDAANNVFTAISNQAELLYCWACHTDSAGGLRDKYVFEDSIAPQYTKPAGRIASVPDLNGSNVCMPCHSGRGTGKEDIKDSSSNFNDKSFANPHYLAAGGVLFKTIGYEYDGASYTGWFQHDSIGSEANGPCVGCHMNHEEGHTFESVERDSVTGEINAATAFENTCSKCHGGTIQGDLEVLREGYEAALDELEAALIVNGIVYGAAHPYFYNAAGYDADYDENNPPGGIHCQMNLARRNWLTNGTTSYIWNATDSECDNRGPAQAGTAGTGKNNMGAAFNLALFHHEPGAYVHNSQYVKKLIFDSIDWAEDGVLNGTISITNTTALGWLGGTSRP